MSPYAPVLSCLNTRGKNIIFFPLCVLLDWSPSHSVEAYMSWCNSCWEKILNWICQKLQLAYLNALAITNNSFIPYGMCSRKWTRTEWQEGQNWEPATEGWKKIRFMAKKIKVRWERTRKSAGLFTNHTRTRCHSNMNASDQSIWMSNIKHIQTYTSVKVSPSVSCALLYLCPCCVMSMARRAGTGDPPSVTLSTSMDLRSGLLFPCRFNMGESTRFRGGSTNTHRYTHAEFQVVSQKKHVDCNTRSIQITDLESISQQLHLITDWSSLKVPAAIKWFAWPAKPAGLESFDQTEPKAVKVRKKVYRSASLFQQ